MTRYMLDPAWTGEKERLDKQAVPFNPGTFRYLETLGVGEGSRCAEIGAGSGTVTRWLCQRVGRSGRVVAVDLDTRFLEAMDEPALEVRRHDILAAPLEEGHYDVVCCRLLLFHLPRPQEAIRNMVASLRPGGWLLTEDYDGLTAGICHPPSDVLRRASEAVLHLFERGGANPIMGRQLAPLLRSAGLLCVEAEARVPVSQCGGPSLEAMALLLEYFRPRLLAAGLLSEDDVQAAVAEARTPSDRVGYPPMMVAAWGQRPGG